MSQKKPRLDVTLVAKHLQNVAKKRELLEDACRALNEALDLHRGKVQDAENVLNKELLILQDLRDGACEEASSYYEDRSEAWQNGDNGHALLDWVSDLEQIDLEPFDVSFDLPEDIDLDDIAVVGEGLSDIPPTPF